MNNIEIDANKIKNIPDYFKEPPDLSVTVAEAVNNVCHKQFALHCAISGLFELLYICLFLH